MKKLLVLIACASAGSIHGMDYKIKNYFVNRDEAKKFLNHPIITESYPKQTQLPLTILAEAEHKKPAEANVLSSYKEIEALITNLPKELPQIDVDRMHPSQRLLLLKLADEKLTEELNKYHESRGEVTWMSMKSVSILATLRRLLDPNSIAPKDYSNKIINKKYYY